MAVDTTESAGADETPDLLGAFPRLSEHQIAALSPYGERRRTEGR
jgi:hypothetical protein